MEQGGAPDRIQFIAVDAAGLGVLSRHFPYAVGMPFQGDPPGAAGVGCVIIVVGLFLPGLYLRMARL